MSTDEKLLRSACAEISHLVRKGVAHAAEEVLQKNSALEHNQENSIELIYAEYSTREELGQTPQEEDYFTRFPDLKAQLARQFQVHNIMLHEKSAAITDPVFLQENSQSLGSPDGTEAQTSSKIGTYHVIGERARGAVGTVYKTRHAELERTVALKVFPPRASSGFDQAFTDEAKTLAKLHHPNIVQLYETGSTPEGQAYLALEWIDGKSLAEELDSGLPAWRESAELLIKAAEAVHFAHQSGIVHRDLKPGNILLTSNGIPKVSDFGLARWIHDEAPDTSGAVVQGTPSYMAPEQVRDSASAGPAADVYSLGAILYELLTGRPPYLSDTPVETLRQVVTEDPIHPLTLQPSAPKDLANIALKCLAKKTDARYASAAELAEDLRHFLNDQPVIARPIPLWERSWKWARRQPAQATLLGLAIVIPLLLYISGIWYVAWLREARNDADQQRKIAQQQKLLVQQQLEKQRRLAYTLQVGRAYSIHQRSPATALSLLDNQSVCSPDLREFSWRLVNHLIPRAQRTFQNGKLAAWSPDGKKIAMGGANGQLAIRSAKNWQTEIVSQKSKLSGMRSIAWSKDGNKIATGDGNKTILWQASTGKIIATLPNTGAPVISLTFSPDSKYLVSVGFRPGTVLLWNLNDKSSRPLLESNDYLHSAAFSPDGSLLAITGETEGVRLFETTSWNPVRHLKLEGAGAFLEFSRDGSQLAVGAWEKGTDLYNTSTWQVAHHLPIQLSRVRALDFSPDDSLLATANQDASVQIWDLSTHQEIQIRRGHSRVVWSVDFSPDGKRIATGSKDGSVKIWNTKPASPNPETLYHADERILSLGISAVDETLIAGDASTAIYQSGQATPSGSGEPAIRSAVSNDGTRIAFTLLENKLKLVQLKQPGSAKFIHLVAQSDALAFSQGDQEIAVGFRDGAIHCFDFATGEATRQFETRSSVTALAWSPDDRFIYVGHSNGSLSRINLTDKAASPLHVQGHHEAVRAFAFSPDGKLFASGGEDALILILSTDDHSIRHRLDQHTHNVNSITFSPDGRTLASGTGDRWVLSPGEVNLWDVVTGQKIITLENQSGPVAFSPDGTRLYTSTEDNEIRVWKTADKKAPQK